MPSNIDFSSRLVCSIQVKDHRAASAWYNDALGCNMLFESEQMGMSFMDTPVPGVSLDLSQVENPRAEGGATLVWGVKNLDDSRAILESKGIRFDGPTRVYDGMVKLATFFDPDGNTLMLFESLSS